MRWVAEGSRLRGMTRVAWEQEIPASAGIERQNRSLVNVVPPMLLSEP